MRYVKMLCKSLHRSEKLGNKPEQNMKCFFCILVTLKNISYQNLPVIYKWQFKLLSLLFFVT